MSDYIPTTEEVQGAYVRENDTGHPLDKTNAREEFDRWLARHDAMTLAHFANRLEGSEPHHFGELDLDPLDYGTGTEYGLDVAALVLRREAGWLVEGAS